MFLQIIENLNKKQWLICHKAEPNQTIHNDFSYFWALIAQFELVE